MENLAEQIYQLLRSTQDQLKMERQVELLTQEFIATQLKKAFERYDDELLPQMQAQGWKVARKDCRRISFSFGRVEFRRRLYQHNKHYCYALDQKIAIQPYQRYSIAQMGKIAKLGTENTYRKEARAIETLSPEPISKTTVRAITNRIGKQAQEYHKYQQEYNLPKKRVLPVLYLEGDAVVLKNQNKSLMYLHRYQVHEGTRENGKKRECIRLHRFSNFRRKIAFNDMLDYLQKHYDLTNTVIISNSDGGSGYEPEVFDELALGCQQHEHFVDRYHLIQKLTERMDFCPELFPIMRKALVYYYSWDKVRVVLDTMLAIALDDEIEAEKEQTELLEKYLKRNWPYLKPFRLRDLPDEIKRSGIGVCESNHRPYTYRMKKQGRTWGKEGAGNVVWAIDAISNEDFDDVLRFIQNEQLKHLDSESLSKAELSRLFIEGHEEHVGVKQGVITPNAPSGSAIGKLRRSMVQSAERKL
ncbi:ISLre2 family transposase [Limosilactobacillus reuteri]|uniref:ISLre2 family transposase n=1 Tax=Limosilactobacillus reuteri TaxID=1598 RepID=UPI001E45E345|nr:ISLre2 family transposase [Limosilactobacillus reuteri]MCC4500335.1 ISLre2 family transposase [Limosilactobacillus reuteri]MCC4500660.1 ISLre2 family transposase [Limosilactobacillus reuteri]